MSLKALRLKRGLTQKQLADKIEQPFQYVSKLETGERHIDNVSLGIAIKIADVLKVKDLRKLLDDSCEQ